MNSQNKESKNIHTKQNFGMTSKSIINNDIKIDYIKNIKDDNTKKSCEKKKKKKKKSKKRCCHKDCNKKLTITAIECKCKKKFCGLHRLPHQHECDYIEHVSKDELMKKRGLGGGNFSQLEKV
jgi:predicted nucleic acid binding AN1-type Zn finger protein